MLLSEGLGVSTPQAGNNNSVVQLLKKYGIPVTRENYLDLVYLGEPPETLTAEEELEMPEALRSKNGAA